MFTREVNILTRSHAGALKTGIADWHDVIVRYAKAIRLIINSPRSSRDLIGN